MDPDEALGRIWEIIENNESVDELHALVGNLLVWLNAGGYPPKCYEEGTGAITLRGWLAGIDAGLTFAKREREREYEGTEELSAIDGIEPLMFDTRATDGMPSGE